MDCPPSFFRTAFSPAKYGADDALMLNGLLWVMEHSGWSNISRQEHHIVCNSGPASRVFSLAQGSELEADLLTMHFLSHSSTLFWRMNRCLVGKEGNTVVATENFLALARLFMPKFLRTCADGVCLHQTYLATCSTLREEDVSLDIARQIGLVRTKLYRRPRQVAFTSGMRGRLGSGSEVRSLSDELCKWILELSFAE
jgi:hypothetical protein